MIAAQAQPAIDWTPYLLSFVKRVTPKGTATTVKLLQVVKDAASIRIGKKTKPVWVPLREIHLPEAQKAEKKEAPPVADMKKATERYVLVDENHHRFFWASKGRGPDPKWVVDPREAVTYADNSSAWGARQYHRKKRPTFFPPHVQIRSASEAAALFLRWSKSDPNGVGAMARQIVGKALKGGESAAPAAPAATPRPAPISGDLFAAWEAKRRELAAAEGIVASVRSELAELEAKLDIEIKRRAIQ